MKGIRGYKLIKSLLKNGRKFRSKTFVASFIDAEYIAATVSISGKICGAVQRNSIRRKIKEYIRKNFLKNYLIFFRIIKYQANNDELYNEVRLFLNKLK